MNTVISEPWITLDTAFLSQNVIILAFQMPNDFRERSFVVNLITESWCINNGERYTGSFLVQFQFNSNWLDPDAFFQVSARWVLGVFGLQDTLSAEGVDECRATCP